MGPQGSSKRNKNLSALKWGRGKRTRVKVNVEPA